MRRLWISVIIFFSSGILSAQTGDGMLWRISGKNLNKSSYLFGTIHLYCDYQSIFTPSILAAIDSSTIVAMELDLNDTGVINSMIRTSSRPSAKSLKKVLKPSEYKTVDSIFNVLAIKSLPTIDNTSPIGLMGYLLASKEITGCDQAIPVDFVVAGLARQAGKTTYGLESFKFQDSLLNAIPEDIQVKWLMDFCRDLPRAKSDMQMMMNAYKAQKSSDLYELVLTNSPEMELFNDLLLVQRNISWVQFLEKNMNIDSYFMAVGAGHLGGKDGLVSLLRKAGYTVTPVE